MREEILVVLMARVEPPTASVLLCYRWNKGSTFPWEEKLEMFVVQAASASIAAVIV
jgi:hypothetical protein